MRSCLLWISLLLSLSVHGQSLLPSQDGERVELSALIELPRVYVSGVCVMRYEEGSIVGSLVNEFGFSAIDFSYDTARDKFRLISTASMLDKWYIRRVLRKDLRQLMHCLQAGTCTYRNERRGITYTFTPLVHATPQ